MYTIQEKIYERVTRQTQIQNKEEALTTNEKPRIQNVDEMEAELLQDEKEVTCLCGRSVFLNESWTDDRVSGVEFCSAECAQKYGDQCEAGEAIP